MADYIRERGREYGTTTGRPRRCGWFDSVAVRLSGRISGVGCMALISLDVLAGLDKLRVCSAYRTGGKIIRDFPSDAAALEECMPIHDELPGWKEDISQVRSFEDLPENARDYVKHITEVTDIEVALVSVGRRREQTLVIRPELLGKRKKRSVGRGH
jgi:adenylosuccinate synthase